AWQVDGYRRVHPALADGRHRGRAGTGAASLGLASTTLPDAQVGAVAVDDLDESGVDPLREARMVLDLRAQFMDRGRAHVVDAQHAMGVAHGHRGDRVDLAV